MKHLIFLETANMMDVELTDLAQYLIITGRNVKLSPHCIETRLIANKPLLIACIDNDSCNVELYRYDELSALMKEGYKASSAENKYEFFKALTVGEFMYCR